MNALSAAADGTVHDYVGGLADLEARRVRFIGDAGDAHRRGLSAHPALLPLPRRLRPGRARRATGLHACIAARAGLDAIVARAGADGNAQAAGRARTRCRRSRSMAEAGLLVPVLGGVPISRASPTWPRSRRRSALRARSGAPARRARRARRRGRRAAVAAAAALQRRARAAGLDGERLVARVAGERAATRARCSTGSGRSASSTACCWPGRARRPARRDARLARARDAAGALDRAGVSAQGRGFHRARRAARARRSAPRCARPRRRGSRRISRPIAAASRRSPSAAAENVEISLTLSVNAVYVALAIALG